ncbi:MAG: hypothetical protein QOJ09_2158, partial [Actinomycetota bacterium]|nr:hypothetical protein [Actinomycetota bacterium]
MLCAVSVPDPLLAWAAGRVGPRARVVSAARLGSGPASTVYGLVVEIRPGGRRERLVLRRFTDAEWLAREPDLVEREALALTIVGAAGTGVAAPELVAADPDASAVLTRRLPGRERW